jgi:hypothetical protein
MNSDPPEHPELPEWLGEALEEGETTDNLPNKRSTSRRVWTVFCRVQSVGEPTMTSFTARLFNVGPGGIGLVTRRELEPGLRLEVVPEGDANQDAVQVRVVHCTQTVQGYKVGCAFEPA